MSVGSWIRSMLICKREPARPARLMYSVRAWSIREPDLHVFFGYYDLCPFNKDESKILAHRYAGTLASPQKNEFIEVGYYKCEGNRWLFQKLGDSGAWCWQLGARLRWFPHVDSSRVIYNHIKDDGLISVIKSLDNAEEKTLCGALFDVSGDGDYGLSLNYHRLQRLRPGYGYRADLDPTTGVACPDDDGIFQLDIKKNTRRMLFSIRDIAGIYPQDSMKNAEHYFNHISINPTGDKFLFYHQWESADRKRKNRVLVYDLKCGDVKVLYNGPVVSHYRWLDDHHILFVILFDSGWKYCKYDTNIGFETILADRELVRDGHPSWWAERGILITDTYPDRNGIQYLLAYDRNSGEVATVNDYKSPEQFRKEFKCDLHPRLSLGRSKICVDYVHGSYRAIGVNEVNWNV